MTELEQLMQEARATPEQRDQLRAIFEARPPDARCEASGVRAHDSQKHGFEQQG